MPDFCAAFGCHKKRGQKTKSRGITFHRFPRDTTLREEWERAVRWKGYVASKTSVLCSDHFKAEDFDRTGQTVRLRNGVKPSVFAFPSHLQKRVKLRTTQTSSKAEKRPVMVPPKPLHEAKPQLNVMPISRLSSVSLMDKITTDHCYALPASPVAQKARLNQVLNRVEKLEQARKKSMIRERRAKENMDALLEELRETNLINEELRQRLVCFSGLASSSSLLPKTSS